MVATLLGSFPSVASSQEPDAGPAPSPDAAVPEATQTEGDEATRETATVPAQDTPEVASPSQPAASPAGASAVGTQNPGPWYRDDFQKPEEPRPRRHWYGWQTLISDGLSVGTLALGERAESSVASVGLLGYLLGPPIIHWVHGHVGKGFGSLGIRTANTLGFSVIYIACQLDSGDACALTYLAMVPAIAIDAILLANEDVGDDSRKTLKLRFAPLADVRNGAGGLFVGGNF